MHQATPWEAGRLEGVLRSQGRCATPSLQRALASPLLPPAARLPETVRVPRQVDFTAAHPPAQTACAHTHKCQHAQLLLHGMHETHYTQKVQRDSMIKHPGPLPDWRCPGFNPLPHPVSHVRGVHGQPCVGRGWGTHQKGAEAYTNAFLLSHPHPLHALFCTLTPHHPRAPGGTLRKAAFTVQAGRRGPCSSTRKPLRVMPTSFPSKAKNTPEPPGKSIHGPPTATNTHLPV